MNLVIDVVVEGSALAAVVDTAAQVTIVNADVAAAWLPTKRTRPTGLQGVGGFRLGATLAEDVQVTLGRRKFPWTIYTAEIAEEMLMGMDMLGWMGAIIDLGRLTLHLGDQVIPARMIRGGNPTLCVVTTTAKVKIPPGTAKACVVQLGTPVPGLWLITPLPEATDALMPATLHEINQDGKARVHLLNDTDRTLNLPEGKVLGTAWEATTPLERKVAGKVRCTGPEEAEPDLPPHLRDLYERSGKELSDQQRKGLKTLLVGHADVFAAHDLDLGCFAAVQHEINTEDATPIRERLRRCPRGFEGEEEQHLQSMLDAGVIQPSSSPWAASPVLVRKKDGGVRWCLDYRKLNNVTKKDAFPLPLISDCLDALAGNVFMSTLDMASGYWQIEIHPRDREKTAFLTRFGLYEHRRMSFGLCNAPSTFQRAMNLVLRGLTWRSVLAFLDDVLVLGRSYEEHLRNLEEVLGRFRAYQLKLKPKKCTLFATRVKFLGKVVTGDTVEIEPDSIVTTREWPTPTRTRDVESFLGFVNYHRDHIPGLAGLARPLYQLTGKAPFRWEEEHAQAFLRLKQAVEEARVLALPQEAGKFVLDTDASDFAIGAALYQWQGDKERPIAFTSRTLNAAQRKYCTTRKELLAIVAFTRQFRHYLLGRAFLVRTDHNSLAWLLRFKSIEGQLARWIEELAQYDMEVVHRKGIAHVNADSLSRLPDELERCNCYRAGTDPSSLPCGGCEYCWRMQRQWERFEEDVDDVLPLAMAPAARATGVDVPCNWALALSDQQKADEQEKDTDLSILRRWLRDKHEPSQEEVSALSPTVKRYWTNRALLQWEKEILWYRWSRQGRDSQLWIVPRQLRKDLLALGHSNVLAGHRGRDATLLRLRENFHWPGMSADVEEFVASCVACNRQKRVKRRDKAELQPFTAGAPMEKVHLDLLGPLPITPSGNRYILVMVDQFTKWVEVAPLPDQTAETVARAAVEYMFTRMGCPLEICTDQGANFMSSLFSRLCELLEIVKKRTTPYHPSANGQVERMNSTLLQMVRCTLRGGQADWDRKLQLLAGAMRATVNRSTGFTPNKLMLGREVSHPLQLMTGVTTPTQPLDEYVEGVRQALEQAHALARDSLGERQMRQRQDYQIHTRPNKYEVGDVVLLANSARRVHQCKKLSPLWVGPYVVVKVPSPVLCTISSSRKTWVVHHDRLRVCREQPLPLWIRRLRSKLRLPGAEHGDVAPSAPPDGRPPFASLADDLPGGSSSLATEPVYCVCRKPDDGQLMVLCDACYEWFHARCMDMTPEAARRAEFFVCPGCQRQGCVL